MKNKTFLKIVDNKYNNRSHHRNNSCGQQVRHQQTRLLIVICHVNNNVFTGVLWILILVQQWINEVQVVLPMIEEEKVVVNLTVEDPS